MYSSLGRRTGYREHLFRVFGCMLAKGLELLQVPCPEEARLVEHLGAASCWSRRQWMGPHWQCRVRKEGW